MLHNTPYYIGGGSVVHNTYNIMNTTVVLFLPFSSRGSPLPTYQEGQGYYSREKVRTVYFLASEPILITWLAKC